MKRVLCTTQFMNADRVDLSLLIEGQQLSPIDTYIEVVNIEGSIFIKLHRDGPRNDYKFTELLTLNGDTIPVDGNVSLQDLMDNGQLLIK